MLHPITLVLGALALAGTAFYLHRIMPTLKRIKAESARLKESGVLADPMSDASHARLMRLAERLRKIFIGKIEAKGEENLAKLKGPFIFVSNHGNPLDLAIMNLMLRRKARHPGAKGVLSVAGGLAAYLGSKFGIFSVDLDNGASARESMVGVLSQGEVIYLFPEAWTHTDGRVHKFKTGTVRVARMASENRHEPCWIVPAYIRYGRYLGKWALALPVALQWVVLLLAFPYFRKGARVVIGNPIDPNLLSAEHHEATEELSAAVIALDPAKGK